MSRDEARKLLPFLVNGTLEGPERRALEAVVAEDPDLSSELAALRAIRDAIQSQATPQPGDLVFARLKRSINAESRDTLTAARPGRNVVRLWQAAAALLLAAIVAQSLYFRTQGQDDVRSYGLAGGAVMRIAFVPDAKEAEIRALLLDAGVEIVEGPSALGFYAIAPVGDADPSRVRSTLESAPIVQALEF